MGALAGIKHGDKVRVTLKGTALGPTDSTGGVRIAFSGRDDGHLHRALGGDLINTCGDYFVSIEKIEPPVKQFGPGDTVRSKSDRDCLYSLGRGGYFSHRIGAWLSYEHTLTQQKDFTSEKFEKVDLG